MRLIIAQGTPVVPSRVLNSITDEAEFFLQINLGHHYAEGSHDEVILKRHGKIDAVHKFTVPRIPGSGIQRLLWLPYVDHVHLVNIRRALALWPDEIRNACFFARLWLTCLGGIRARDRGEVDKVVYWLGDFFPIVGKIEDRIISAVFQQIDKHCVRKADAVWYITKRIYDAHATRSGKRHTAAPERIAPSILNSYPEVHHLWSSSGLHRTVYVGLVRSTLGLDVILPAIAIARRQLPDLTLAVVGDGPDLDRMRQTTKELGIEDAVQFHGYVKDESVVHELVARCAAGFALFPPDSGYPYYTLTSKAHLYIGCGTPVIITESAGSFDYVMQGKAGIRADYNPESVAQSILKACSNIQDQTRLRDAARGLATDLDRDRHRLLSAFQEVMAL